MKVEEREDFAHTCPSLLEGQVGMAEANARGWNSESPIWGAGIQAQEPSLCSRVLMSRKLEWGQTGT